ncbi:uncharacterized protein LOC111886193 [Lactuca sativa]|uniref:uncharacterized protein LOC111886193 n=1 Tax=Lactuca sativa TaxID=4236 RepID=UPI0022B022A0|nr:uncharacterized protein LOC111886193 [Lactuca sativa]
MTTSSSSIKLNPGCHKLKTKARHLSPIPLIDLTEDVENIHQVNRENLILGISNEYLDHGDQDVVCQTCRAKLWRNESIRGKEKGNTDYSLCCAYGKVQLPDLKNAPLTYERIGEKDQSTSIDSDIIEDIKVMLDSNNVLVRSYRMVRDTFPKNPEVDMKLRLIERREQDGRTYNLPTASEVAALIIGDISDSIEKRDIVIQTKNGCLQRISELHPSYLPLQYPLLFPYGDDGYSVDILHRGVSYTTDSTRAKCTMREYFSYRIQDRDHSFSLILNSRRLFQQFLLDAYTMMETERMYNIRRQQLVLRCNSYENIRNQKAQGTTDISNVGQRVILPSSFTGGARYMLQSYLDAMSLCKWFGYPDFFITFTCNPKWPEIKRFLKDTSLQPEDRPYILCRLFKIKLDAFIKDLREKQIFGKVQAYVYTIEFQKRGLPHSHICLFMHSDNKLPTVELIDPIISAEIPDRIEDLELYSLVNEFMIHGPCGAENINCPCMVDKKCSKNFPKQFSNHSFVDQNGFPLYRRRNDGHFVEKSRGSSIKYLFKYINKGPDRATVAVVPTTNECENNDAVDEIAQYYDYILLLSDYLFIFLINSSEDDDIDEVLDKPFVAASKFTAWMECNSIDSEARKLTYVEFPTKCVWILNGRFWKRRKVGKAIGRIHSVSPKLGEAYFLRILLNKVKGPTSFDDIRTVNGQTHSSFRDACYALGLLDDDKEYIDAIKEASHSGSGFYLRFLFATLLMCNNMPKPEVVWENTWEYLTDGILYSQRQRFKSAELSLGVDELKNLTLFEIQQILLQNNSTLKNFKNMSYPDVESVSSSNNRLITEELDYDVPVIKNDYDRMFLALTNEQRNIFLNIMSAIQENKGCVFFVYGYGGTGKTFLSKTISATIRSEGNIVLNVASSGIASLLLPGGRTTHSRFIIPFELTEDSFCDINPDGELASLIIKTSLIIWDEAPMVHKHAFEALDRTLKDLLRCVNSTISNIPFGGKVIVFGGDFRQILPVVSGGNRQNIINASLSSSYLWQHCKVHRLTKNMRLTIGRDQSDIGKIRDFANWLLDIGEGKLSGPNDGETIIDIPDDILINDSHDPIGSLIEFVYPSILENYSDINYFQERAILALKNEVVQEINDRLLKKFPGDEIEYLSSYSICESEYLHDQFDSNLYSPDVLNGLKVSGLPNHKLVLKIGVPVMLLRNIDQKNGLCNGTRLQVLSLGKRVIEARIITGTNIGNQTFIPRMSLTPSEKKIPFKFTRRQFHLAVCFAMTINKSQGQSLSKASLDSDVDDEIICDDSSDSCISDSEVISRTTLVPIKPKFHNPSSGKTSKSSSDSRVKPWLNMKDIVNPKREAKNALNKEIRSRQDSKFIKRSEKKVSRTTSPTTRNQNTFLHAKILKRSSNLLSLVTPNKFVSPNLKKVTVENHLVKTDYSQTFSSIFIAKSDDTIFKPQKFPKSNVPSIAASMERVGKYIVVKKYSKSSKQNIELKVKRVENVSVTLSTQ